MISSISLIPLFLAEPDTVYFLTSSYVNRILYPDTFSKRFNKEGRRSLLNSIVISVLVVVVCAFAWGDKRQMHAIQVINRYHFLLIYSNFITQILFRYTISSYENKKRTPLLLIFLRKKYYFV